MQISRSAITGKFVTAAYARVHPETTVTENLEVMRRTSKEVEPEPERYDDVLGVIEAMSEAITAMSSLVIELTAGVDHLSWDVVDLDSKVTELAFTVDALARQ